jgi:hypothetical protein
MLFIVTLVCLALGIFMSHAGGLWLTRSLALGPGAIREVMPLPPALPPQTGRADRRWSRKVRSLEAKLLLRFAPGATGVEASALAAELGEPPELVEATLAHLREEIPCRLRITRHGRMLHDFAPQDIAQLAARRAASIPRRVAWLAAAALANIGAAWPVIAMTGVAGFALLDMWASQAAAGAEAALNAGIAGLIVTGLIFGGTLLLGVISRFVLWPMRSGPQLGDVATRDSGAAAIQQRHSALAAADAATDPLWYFSWNSSSSSSWRSSSPSSSSFDVSAPDIGGVGDLDEAAVGCLVVIVAALLLAVIASCFFALGVWLRGLWRAITRDAGEERQLSPAAWTRFEDVIDRYERFIPTNDLVGRMTRTLRRVYTWRRPQDADMPARILGLAKHHDGLVSALQISMWEGMSLDDAASVGTRLVSHAGGEVRVSDEGDLAFAFPEALWRYAALEPDDDADLEYVRWLPDGRLARRSNQSVDSVPVNLPGLNNGHLVAAERLVAGSIIMALTAPAALTGLSPAAWHLPLTAAVGVIAAGVMTLYGVARYTTRLTAAQGVLRDMRRVALNATRDALLAGRVHVNLDRTIIQFHELLLPAWGRLTIEQLRAEAQAALTDLGLEPDEALAGKGAHVTADLRHLQRRWRAIQQAEFVVFDPMARDEGADEVVFDTAVEHERVVALI